MTLFKRLDELHTTPLGLVRIKDNLGLDDEIDVVKYCKKIIKDSSTIVERIGKNYYATSAKGKITINASKMSIITAHQVKNIK